MRFITQPDNTKALLIEEPKRMAIAHTIAEASACLDDLKRTDASMAVMNETRDVAPLHRMRLENLVRELAGDRIGEIYAPDAMFENNLLAAARCGCCGGVESDIDHALRLA